MSKLSLDELKFGLQMIPSNCNRGFAYKWSGIIGQRNTKNYKLLSSYIHFGIDRRRRNLNLDEHIEMVEVYKIDYELPNKTINTYLRYESEIKNKTYAIMQSDPKFIKAFDSLTDDLKYGDFKHEFFDSFKNDIKSEDFNWRDFSLAPTTIMFIKEHDSFIPHLSFNLVEDIQ